ncbi:hypothetical protein [Roseivivax sp. CAU 1753]
MAGVTPLRQRMIEDINIRGLAKKTQMTQMTMIFSSLAASCCCCAKNPLFPAVQISGSTSI